jgi:hypothetical protein
MLTKYLQQAMELATYEVLEDGTMARFQSFRECMPMPQLLKLLKNNYRKSWRVGLS